MTLVAEPGLVSAEAEAQPRRRGYGSYVGRKVLGSLGSLLFMLLVNFFLFRMLPGDPARSLRVERAAPAAVPDVPEEHVHR